MSLEDLKVDEFEIKVSEDGDVIVLGWSGSMHVPNPEEDLEPFFDTVLDSLKKNQSLRCDFTGLEYMNSASIPPLIQLLRRLAEDEINGEFVYDSSRKVQTASFRALDVIARKSEFTTVRGV